MTAFVPAGWPESVRPPGAPGWQRSATVFLLDQCPADFRGIGVLRRHPVVLARFALAYVRGQERTAREGLADVRTGLAELVDPPVVAAAVEAWLAQTARLARTKRAVGLIAEALEGGHFTPRL